MQIPYEVKARPDTGLWNAKIGIWLFLASEVMLFGGLFTGYVFLRLGAAGEPDYYWPEGALDVKWGFINTLVLILSSVFVVVAWLQLKLRDYRKFQIWMGLVVLCSLIFLAIKSIEYYGKFTHYGIKLSDNSIVEGHHPDDTIQYDNITDFAVQSHRFNGGLTEALVGDDLPKVQLLDKGEPVGETFIPSTAGIRALADRTNDALRKAWEETGRAEAKAANVEIRASNAELSRDEQQPLRYDGPWLSSMEVHNFQLRAQEPFSIRLRFRDLRQVKVGAEGERDAAKFMDQTEVVGDISAETQGIELELDRIDLRATDGGAEGSLVWAALEHGEDEKHHFLERRDQLLAEAAEDGGEASHDEIYNQKLKHDGDHHTKITVPWDEVRLFSNFTPKWNTYYAIYFTLTGLHGLHVLAGAIVLFYFGFMSKWLYDKNPEHLANRVEVGGLFWHFVDLVWIFLFPILYLM